MRSERGFTMIELLIYSMLATVVLVIVGGMLINALNAQNTVRDATDASNTGQLVSQSVTHGVRHARALDLDAPTAGSEVLRALVVDDAVTTPVVAHCEAWYFGGGEIRTTRSDTQIPLPLNPADVSDWTLLADGALPVGTAPVFAISGLTADLRVQLDSGKGLPVLIETTAASRQPNVLPSGVESLCF